MLDVQLVVIAKAPVAGRSKTRLCPPLTPEEAAQVAQAALLDTLDAVAATPVRHRVVVLDGADDLIPEHFVVQPQCEGPLEVRLAAAVTEAFAARPLPILLIGMDTPQVTPTLLGECAQALLDRGSALGLAEDGGWWAIGLPGGDGEVFSGVPMSADDTGAHQLAQMNACGLRPVALPVLRDIDRVEDLAQVAAEMPGTSRVARISQQLLSSSASGPGGSV